MNMGPHIVVQDLQRVCSKKKFFVIQTKRTPFTESDAQPLMIPSPRKPLFEAEWREIRLFPGYSVSDDGHVRNDKTGYYLTRLVNQYGVVYVGLNSDNKTHNRSVALLVAEAFLPPPVLRVHFDTFDTPINLDGDRANNHIRNLAWRPLWFARKYHQQFHAPRRGLPVPIQDLATGVIFENSWEAAVQFGLLDEDIKEAIERNDEVWPTRQTFVLVTQTHIVSPRNRGL